MSPVFIFLVCFIVGTQCLPASLDQSGEAFRIPEPDGDRRSRLPRDTANQKWIQRIEDYSRTQMTQGLGLLNPFRLNLPLDDSAEALPVLVLPVPIYGGCKDVKSHHQSDRDTGIISNQIPMFSPNDGYHFVAPGRATERPTYPHQGVQVASQSNPITTSGYDSIIEAIFRPKVPLLTTASPLSATSSKDSSSSVNAEDSQEMVPAKSIPPLPQPLTTVLPTVTVNMDTSRDNEDYIPPRFFNY